MAGHSRLEPEDPGLLSLTACGKRLGRSRDYMYKLAREGRLPFVVQIGDDYVVSIPKLERYLHGDSDEQDVAS
jgi:predicted DNA-binding transcriptional regulator AlpA